jgi:predicted PurR-regulated permease PerM
VPAVGVLLVIVPVSGWLAITGHPGHAVIALVWGMVFVVGTCDYVIRPRLMRGHNKTPALVTFAALFGGIEVFGIQGLILGPVMIAVAFAVLRLYAAEARRRRGDDVTDVTHPVIVNHHGTGSARHSVGGSQQQTGD